MAERETHLAAVRAVLAAAGGDGPWAYGGWGRQRQEKQVGRRRNAGGRPQRTKPRSASSTRLDPGRQERVGRDLSRLHGTELGRPGEGFGGGGAGGGSRRPERSQEAAVVWGEARRGKNGGGVVRDSDGGKNVSFRVGPLRW
jgi:hypothetical protein